VTTQALPLRSERPVPRHAPLARPPDRATPFRPRGV